MKNSVEGCVLAEQQTELKGRVDRMENRLTAVEVSLRDSREENKTGFDDIKTQLNNIYAERAEWGKWAREHIGRVLKWIGWIVLAACGINQTSEILKFFFRAS